MTALELLFLDWLQEIMASPFFDIFWQGVTHLGDLALVWIALTILLTINPKTRPIGWTCAIGLLLGVLITNGLLKNLVARPRPFTHNGFEILIKEPYDWSFPSGHTTASFVVAFIMFRAKVTLKGFKVYLPVMLLASLIAFSRMYLYVHFPTDLIAAIMIAYLCCRMAEETYKRLQTRSSKKS